MKELIKYLGKGVFMNEQDKKYIHEKLHGLGKQIKSYVNKGFTMGGLMLTLLGLTQVQTLYNNTQYQKNMETYQRRITNQIQDYKSQQKEYQKSTKKELDLLNKKNENNYKNLKQELKNELDKKYNELTQKIYDFK